MLEQRIKELNDVVHAGVIGHADLLGEYFDAQGAAMAGIREAQMLSIGPRLPVPPALVPRELPQRLGRLHEAFRAGLRHMFAHRMAGSWSRLADELRLDDAVRRYVPVDRQPRWARFGRPDVVVHGDAITMVEPNVGTSCGAMPDADILSRLFEDAPVIGDLLKQVGARRTNVVRTVAEVVRTEMRRIDRAADALVVVTDVREVLSDPAFYHCEVFAQEFRRHGMSAEAVAAEDLEVSPSRVAFRGRTVGALYRMFGEQTDPEGLHPVLAPLIDAAERGVVALVDNLSDQIAGNKTILAMLSEEIEYGRLPPALTDQLSRFIPWSRLLEDGWTSRNGDRVDLLPWCEAQQQHLVIKPGAGFQGRGVTVGCEVSPEAWRQAIEVGVNSSEAWLVQELVRSNPARVSIARDGGLVGENTFVDYGYYAVADTVPAGMIRRSAPFGTKSRKIKRAAIGPVFFV